MLKEADKFTINRSVIMFFCQRVPRKLVKSGLCFLFNVDGRLDIGTNFIDGV